MTRKVLHIALLFALGLSCGARTLYGNESLSPGQQLLPGQNLESTGGRFQLAHQTDGNVVLYMLQKTGTKALWSTCTVGKTTTRLIMQEDGNLVLYGNDAALWSTRTDGAGLATLTLQDDGNLVLYRQGVPIWNTNTLGFPESPELQAWLASKLHAELAKYNSPQNAFHSEEIAEYKVAGVLQTKTTVSSKTWLIAPEQKLVVTVDSLSLIDGRLVFRVSATGDMQSKLEVSSTNPPTRNEVSATAVGTITIAGSISAPPTSSTAPHLKISELAGNVANLRIEGLPPVLSFVNDLAKETINHFISENRDDIIRSIEQSANK